MLKNYNPIKIPPSNTPEFNEYEHRKAEVERLSKELHIILDKYFAAQQLLKKNKLIH